MRTTPTFVASTVIPKLLPAEGWNKPLSGETLNEIDRAVNTDLLNDGVLRVKFYAPDGTVVYSI